MDIREAFILTLAGCTGARETNPGVYELTFIADQNRLATAAEILAATKTGRIESDRQECRRRLIEHYGDALEQGSRFVGGYGAQAQASIIEGTVAARAASNAARDEINLTTTNTAAKVNAVVVNWPVLP